MSTSPAPKRCRTEEMLASTNPLYPHSPEGDRGYPDGEIEGAAFLGDELDEAKDAGVELDESKGEGVEGSMFADPEPHVEMELQEGILRTVVPAPSVSVSQEVQDLFTCATSDPSHVRAHIRSRAEALAVEAGCQHEDPLKKWDRARPGAASTCGRLQSSIVAGIKMQDVLDRQRHRGSDDIGYCLSRTVRSCIQYQASVALGAVGAGNQCRRGKCMEKAMSMFGGKGTDGIPAAVVEALCKF